MTSRLVSLRAARITSLVLTCVLGACTSDEKPPGPSSRAPGVALLQIENAQVAPGGPVRLRCTADDPDGDRLVYVFDWGQGGTLPQSPEVDSGTTSGVDVPVSREGSYQARCRAVDSAGTAGAWSPQLTFIVGEPPPDGNRGLQVEVVGQGRVTSTPSGVDCPGTCSVRHASGTRLTLEAVPAQGWQLLGTSACEGTVRSCELLLDADKVVTVRFAPVLDTALSWQRTGAQLPASPEWSPDGTLLAAVDGSVSTPGVLRVWDATQGRVKRLTAAVAPARFSSVAWKPGSGAVLAVGLSTGSVAVLDAVTGVTLREWPVQAGNVRALAWSPDGTRLATATDANKEVHFWNPTTGERAGQTLTAVDKVHRLAWSPDGVRIAMQAGTLSRWVEFHAVGTQGPEELLPDAAGFAWSPDGARFAAGFQGEVKVYSTTGYRVEATHAGAWGLAAQVDWSADGRWLGVGGPARQLFVLDAGTGAVVVDASQVATGANARGYDALRFHPTKPQFVVVDDLPATLDVFTVDSGAATYSRREVLPHRYTVRAAAWSPTGDVLASSGDEGKVRLWNRAGDSLRTLDGHGGQPVRALAWNLAGTRLTTGGDDGVINVWNAEDGTLAQLPIRREPTPALEVYQVAPSPDGVRVASVMGVTTVASQRGVIRVHHMTNGAELFRFPDGSRQVLSLAWTPEGKLVVAYFGMSWDVWDPVTQAITTLAPVADTSSLAAALSPDGTKLAFGGRPGLALWEVSTGRQLAQTPFAFSPEALAWSADGRRVAGGGLGGQVFVWDTSVPALPATVIGFHDNNVSAVSWGPEGNLVATGGRDGSLRVWRFTP
ncbi:WD40 repeat domain-containing protein [Myxococcus qinghaiensis]|uniref:WD40 repeat domain-containing protein n=1 Tax=Myxococcus qinghaiensis TaxID=2906758 RepID=UPI0020A7C365|nr:WD40 repeat domain-containing protein [Myxococcus qinghaiensis]MCP3164289.1 WD40 repeat domain-containing protein [Myxococcus qinghaiensis]